MVELALPDWIVLPSDRDDHGTLQADADLLVRVDMLGCDRARRPLREKNGEVRTIHQESRFDTYVPAEGPHIDVTGPDEELAHGSRRLGG